jgi:hypothetical protein
MKRLSSVIALSAIAWLAPDPLAAQAGPAGAQPALTWYRAQYARFKPGMAEEARRIIYDHFWPVDREIGRQVIAFDFMTGEWDHVVYIPLAGGPADLAVAVAASDQRWQEALARREGGQAKANELLWRLSDMLLAEKTEIVSARIGPK